MNHAQPHDNLVRVLHDDDLIFSAIRSDGRSLQSIVPAWGAVTGIRQSMARVYDLERPIATVQASLLLDRR